MELPSGAVLKVTMSDFATSKALYQIIAEELKDVKVNSSQGEQFGKDVFCVAISSKKIQAAVWECAKRATYNGKRIDADTFEPEEARQDYLAAMFEITRVNTVPFMKDLYAKFLPLLQSMGIILP